MTGTMHRYITQVIAMAEKAHSLEQKHAYIEAIEESALSLAKQVTPAGYNLLMQLSPEEVKVYCIMLNQHLALREKEGPVTEVVKTHGELFMEYYFMLEAQHHYLKRELNQGSAETATLAGAVAAAGVSAPFTLLLTVPMIGFTYEKWRRHRNYQQLALNLVSDMLDHGRTLIADMASQREVISPRHRDFVDDRKKRLTYYDSLIEGGKILFRTPDLNKPLSLYFKADYQMETELDSKNGPSLDSMMAARAMLDYTGRTLDKFDFDKVTNATATKKQAWRTAMKIVALSAVVAATYPPLLPSIALSGLGIGMSIRHKLGRHAKQRGALDKFKQDAFNKAGILANMIKEARQRQENLTRSEASLKAESQPEPALAPAHEKATEDLKSKHKMKL